MRNDVHWAELVCSKLFAAEIMVRCFCSSTTRLATDGVGPTYAVMNGLVSSYSYMESVIVPDKLITEYAAKEHPV